MAKRKRVFQCTACGHQEPKWLGQCPACDEWNTLVERELRVGSGGGLDRGAPASASAGPGGTASTLLSAISATHSSRVSTGIAELDRALGGGLVLGTTILIGGEPGIGKSTLMLQMAASVRAARVLYVSGEENAPQIRRRAERLGVDSAELSLLCTTDADLILNELETLGPQVVVIDSIQTVVSPDAGSVPGTVNQIKLVTHHLAEWAHRTDATVIMVAHVTKEGQIAGPKVVEHLVDAVLLFEHSGSDLRFLRATKNRFGAIEELGIFTMESQGLVELRDPGRAFLGADRRDRPAGVVAAPCYEGSRVLLVEIQALTVPAKGSVSRSFSERIDNRRVGRVAAVLEKHVGIRFSDQDLYINVAGGMRIQDVAIDLPLALALYSARTGISLPAATLATGELTLAGEVRPVSHRLHREKAAREVGFSRLVGPPALEESNSDLWQPVPSISEAITRVFGTRPS
ncbi:MAG: DNA repair protein RadA [Alkalispirochaeta sp.]